MATLFDIGLLRSFDVVFPFLLVWALVFALLQKTKVIGQSMGINSVIATVAAFTVLLSQTAIDIINFMIPWFVIALIFFVLLILIFQTFGAKEEHVLSALQKDKAIGWVIVGVALVIMIAAFGNVLGQKFTESAFQGTSVNATTNANGVATANFQQNITATLFHPKVLGLMVLFAIAIFAVALLSG
ncbi:TPA: hypothetical protein HA242_05915 [Candidatus Woesearchaeota archaeon]|nr:hypothetical protein [Candidatus Woesearchaeota archaeon]HIG93153.1 hypothetical protein [Candidatus Woesearchaeota archaeon]HIH13232.1 hypothetical protein [Candidatus Woesearchaeota archaeon]